MTHTSYHQESALLPWWQGMCFFITSRMYELRTSEIIGLRTTNIDLEKMKFGVVEQMLFKVLPGAKIITEMAPTKSNDRILPITEETLPYFLRQFDLLERQKDLITAGGGEYYDNILFIAKPDGSPYRRDRRSANFGQLIRHLEMPHIRFHDLRHPYVKHTPKNIFCHSIICDNHYKKSNILRSNNQCLSRILLQLNNSRHVTKKAVVTGIPIINIIYN